MLKFTTKMKKISRTVQQIYDEAQETKQHPKQDRTLWGSAGGACRLNSRTHDGEEFSTDVAISSAAANVKTLVLSETKCLSLRI